jgi:hypothetical protein
MLFFSLIAIAPFFYCDVASNEVHQLVLYSRRSVFNLLEIDGSKRQLVAYQMSW